MGAGPGAPILVRTSLGLDGRPVGWSRWNGTTGFRDWRRGRTEAEKGAGLGLGGILLSPEFCPPDGWVWAGGSCSIGSGAVEPEGLDWD